MRSPFRRRSPLQATIIARHTLAALAAGIGCGEIAAADIASYPERPVRLLVGFAPGGATDTTARLIGGKLSESLGQQVVVDNRPGAAGNLAAGIVADATPDGHTLLMGTIAALAINPTLYGKLSFDPVRDFAPITRAVNSTNVLVVHPSVPTGNVRELIELAKTRPGGIAYGSAGVGGAGYLAGELFCAAARIKLSHVPYKGAGPMMADLLAGQIQAAFATATSAIPHIKSGRIKPLGVTTAQRAGMLPEVPTIAEQGLKGFDANNWYGLLAPARTPRAIVDRLHAEVIKVLAMPDVREALVAKGLDPAPTSPEEFGAYIRSEIAKWARVVRAAGASSG
jgi:tripartite-type tricarboxylate transporter receptor subunit TctC